MNRIEKIKSFFRDVYVELRKVSWMSRREVVRYTIAVIVFTLVVAGILGGLDYLFSTILRTIIL